MASLYASVAPQFTRELLSPGLRVGVTDDGGVWQFVAPSLSQRLPLRAIEWRNLVGVTKRIEQLPLHFVAARSGEEPPPTCVYLAKCEDLDAYRSAVRPPLAAWVDAMTAAKVEWLVLYVPLGTRAKAAGNQPNPVYRKIFERLRADFAHPRRGGALLGGAIGPASASSSLSLSQSSTLLERVCKIDTLEGTSVLGQQQQHESQWTELLLRLRRCVMDAFQTRCFQYEERLRVLDARRGTAGWDFGAFFLAKERLALMYQQMYLQDDAIRHLDELDAIFVNLNEAEKQTFRDGSKRSLGAHDAIFTQSPLALDLSETQPLIASNRASARLVSLHCFCRQIRTLYVMGSFPQLLQRASAFIESFLAELKDMAAEGTLDWHQPFLWAVGACLEVAYACELSWSGRDEEWTASSVSVQVAQAVPVEDMSRALGNVLYLARRMLKNFARSSRNRSDLRVSFSSAATGDVDQAEAPLAWYRQLEQVLVAPEWQRSETCEAYERCLSEVSHLASMHFSQSGRHRFAVFLGGECARYHLTRGEYESASRLLRSLARQSEEDGWWAIFGACVRSICRAELALGRSTQAVAACFSMLQLAQEENVGVSKEEMEQLMHTLVTSLGNNAATNDKPDTDGDDGTTVSASMMNMGELFRPTVAVETTQTSGSALEHGDIRVTLGITNEFPAGVHLEKVRIRFESTPALQTLMASDESTIPSDEILQVKTSFEQLNDSVLGKEANLDVRIEGDDEDTLTEIPLVEHNPSISVETATPNSSAQQPCDGTQELEQLTEVLLEENDVHLDEKTGINLVFLHSGVPVGRYTCTGIECVLVGSTFSLLPPSTLALAGFEIAAKESTVQVAIHGAPLLMPRPYSPLETVVVSIQANEDNVADGTLELRVFRRPDSSDWDKTVPRDPDEEVGDEDENCGEEACGIQLIEARLRGDQDQQIKTENNEANEREECSKLCMALPPLPPGSSLTYDVSLMVPPIDRSSFEPEDEDGDDFSFTIDANVRYQREGVRINSSAPTATTEIRCAESTFRVVQPLTETIRLKRVGSRIFASIALKCNHFSSVVLRDYALLFPGDGGDFSTANTRLLTVQHDPNTSLRGVVLRPNDCVHLAFTLSCSPDFEKEASNSFCLLQLHLQYGDDETWQKSMVVRIALAEVEGKRYRIDVVPRGQQLEHKFTGEVVEATAIEPVTFQVHVQEEVSEFNKAVSENDTNVLALCLNESSERDWILVGKQLERFSFSPMSGGHNDRRREFSTQKRLLAIRTGQLRFPSFRLEINGQVIPAARVHCQQSSRRVIVT
ncbi:hypothetical protein PF008_g21079 [Phytophthora fragariae]|uniref:Uncharacterized protein n=1 Tax=Phytophthora fragariae TaxID=53985 RepID=A0A6G0QXL1_9STRA|nr:hypothetical protein PF008_g21079 [Phytophthora fragariae]